MILNIVQCILEKMNIHHDMHNYHLITIIFVAKMVHYYTHIYKFLIIHQIHHHLVILFLNHHHVIQLVVDMEFVHLLKILNHHILLMSLFLLVHLILNHMDNILYLTNLQIMHVHKMYLNHYFYVFVVDIQLPLIHQYLVDFGHNLRNLTMFVFVYLLLYVHALLNNYTSMVSFVLLQNKLILFYLVVFFSYFYFLISLLSNH